MKNGVSLSGAHHGQRMTRMGKSPRELFTVVDNVVPLDEKKATAASEPSAALVSAVEDFRAKMEQLQAGDVSEALVVVRLKSDNGGVFMNFYGSDPVALLGMTVLMADHIKERWEQ